MQTFGDTPVTIRSNGMRGYDVYVDGIYIGKETSGDGSFSFKEVGDMYHDIRYMTASSTILKESIFREE